MGTRFGRHGWLSSRLVIALVVVTASCWQAAPAAAWGGWTWPVVGPVIRGFDPPDDPYGPGHRGIDIATAVGTPVVAVAAGVVSFAGPVGGDLFVSVDHGSGLVSTYSWLSSIAVRAGDVVAAGVLVGTSGMGHAGVVPAHLHLGARSNGIYVDPLELLVPLDVGRLISLAPLPQPPT